MNEQQVPPCAWHGGAVALKQTELRITWGDGRQKLMVADSALHELHHGENWYVRNADVRVAIRVARRVLPGPDEGPGHHLG